ncbi:hypothetical protein ACP4OV_013723 [Aristida adscensionis]
MFVLDPLNYAEENLEECSALLRRSLDVAMFHYIASKYNQLAATTYSAFKTYCDHTEGVMYRPSHKTLRLRSGFKCYKQPKGTNLCGYFVCQYMQLILDFAILDDDLECCDLEKRPPDSKIQDIQNKISHFIMHNVIKEEGEFHDPENNSPEFDTKLPDPRPEGSSSDHEGNR